MADARIIISAIDQATAQIDKLRGGFDSLATTIKSVIGGISVGLAVREFTQAADAATLMNARLKLVTGSMEEFNEARAESYRIAQANNVGLEETARLYTKLAEPIKRLGGDTKEVSGIVEAFAASLRVGGASTQEAAAATLQFAQAMASGRLNGDEFRSLAEASPRFMKALADGMGVPIERLKEMSKEGKLTADVVGNALLKSLAELKDEAEQIPDTVGGAMQRMKNDAFLFAEQINASTGATEQMAEVIGTTSGLFREFSDAVGAASVELGSAGQQFDLVGTTIGAIGTVVETLTVVFANVAYVAKTTATEIAVWYAQAKEVLSGNWAEAKRIGEEWTRQAEANRRAIDKFSEGVVGATGRILQQRDALKNHSLTAKENSDEIARLAARSGVASGEFKKLASNIKDTADEQKTAKKAADEYGKAAKDVLELTSKSLGVSGDYVEKLKALELWYSRNTDKTEEYRQAVEALIWSQESSKRVLREQEDAQKAANRAAEDAIDLDEKQRQAKEESIRKARELVEGLEFEASALQETNTEREISIRLRELEKLGIEQGSEAYRVFAQRIREAVVSKEAVQANITAAEESRKAWDRTAGQIEQALTDALVQGFTNGKSIAKSIGDWIKNYFLTNVARSIAQALTGAIGSVLSGVGNAAGFNIGNLLGGGSSGGAAGNVLNLGSLASSILGGGSSFVAGIGSTLAGNASMAAFSGLLANGSYAAAAGMAMPYLLPVLAGIAALTSIFGNDRSPAQQNYSIVGNPNAFSFVESAKNLQSGSAYDQILQPIVSSVSEIVAKLGGSVGSTSYGLYTSASPDGLGAQVVGSVQGSDLSTLFYSDTNASNESMQQRISDLLPQLLLAGLQDANLPEEFARYFDDLQIGTATAQQINDAIAQAVAAAEAKSTGAQDAQDATIETAVYTSRTADLLEQQLSILDRIAAGIDQLINVTAEVASRPIEINLPEVNGGLT